MSSGALYYWKRDIEQDVRIVMRDERLVDFSTAACKTWARQFIQEHVPWWHPGDQLRRTEQRDVGAAFEGRLTQARRHIAVRRRG